MKYLTKKQKDQLCIAIRGKFFASLSISEEKFMTAHFEKFKSYRTLLEGMFLPIGDRSSFTESENEFISNLYLNKIPLYIVKEALPYAQEWLRGRGLQFKSICILKEFIKNTLQKQRTADAMLRVGGDGGGDSQDWTEGGKDRWGYKAWLRRSGENFDLWQGPLGEQ